MFLIGCPRDCYDTCGLRVYVDGGRIVKVLPNDDIYTQSILCPRAAGDAKRVYSSNRVLYPMLNTGNGFFKRINWDEALDILVSKLKDVIDSHGVEKAIFLEYAGNRGLLSRYASRRLWYFLGVTQTDRSICASSGQQALELIYGSAYGIFPNEIDNLNAVVVWGSNPAVSAIHLWRKILNVRSRGGKIITVDIRLSETAKQSTHFIRVRPGSDGYLALGVAKYLVEHNYVDRDFINRYVYGFEEFVKHLENYSMDIIEKVTGVSREEIARFAEILVSCKPFAIFIGYGVQRRYGGGEIVRSIAVIPALLGIHRGFYYSNTDGLPINLSLVDGSSMWRPRKVVSMERVGKEIFNGNYKFVYINVHNPAATLPNASKIVEGFKRDDVFVVVHDTHWSDTAKVADLVLPAPTFFEKLDVVFSYSHNIVYLNKPVIEPLGESLGEYQLMCEIAKRIAPSFYQEICPDPYKVFEMAFGEEILRKLMENGFVELKPKPRDEYQTPTKRIEFYSTTAEKMGLPPLPTPPKGDFAEDGEFILISSAHILYTHTQFEEVYGPIPGELHISLEDAEKLGIKTGDLVEVYNEKNSVVLKAVIDHGLSKGVLWTPRQAKTVDGKRVNVLLDDGVDSFGGSVLNSTKVKVRRIGTS